MYRSNSGWNGKGQLQSGFRAKEKLYTGAGQSHASPGLQNVRERCGHRKVFGDDRRIGTLAQSQQVSLPINQNSSEIDILSVFEPS